MPVSNERSIASVAGSMRSSSAVSQRAVRRLCGRPTNQTPPAPSVMSFAVASGSIVETTLCDFASMCVSVPSPLFSTHAPP